MADATPRLGLPLLAAAQAQKHVTHNEALTVLDVLAQIAVKSRSLTLPVRTGSPSIGLKPGFADGPQHTPVHGHAGASHTAAGSSRP